MPVETLSPAEQIIAESKAAREAFFDQANKEVFEPAHAARQASITPSGLPIRPTGPQDTQGQKAQTNEQVQPTPSQPTVAEAIKQSTVAIAESAKPIIPDFSDVPPADALDKPGTRLRSADWRRVHAKADHYANQVAALAKEIELLKSAGPKPGEPTTSDPNILTQLKAEKDQLVAQLEAVAFQNSPRFKQMFESREKAAVTMAKQAVGPQLADQVVKILEMPEGSFRDSQVASLMDDIKDNPVRANKLMTAVSLLDQLGAEKQVALENSKNYITQWQSEQAQREALALEDRKKKVSSVFENELNEWKKTASGLVDEQVAATAREVFAGTSSLESAARAALWGAIGPKVAQQAKALEGQIAAMTEELNRLRNVQPGAASDAGGTIESDTETVVLNPKQGMYAEGIAAAILKAGLPLR